MDETSMFAFVSKIDLSLHKAKLNSWIFYQLWQNVINMYLSNFGLNCQLWVFPNLVVRIKFETNIIKICWCII
jgi:hypothetical protein